MDGGNARTRRRILEPLHLAHHFHEKKKLAIIHSGSSGNGVHVAGGIRQVHLETGVDNDRARTIFLKDLALVGFPALAIGRVGKHEVEAGAGEFVSGERGTVTDVLGVVALDHHVGFADGIGLRVDLLAVEVDGGIRADGSLGIDDEILGLGEHAARAAGRIVDGDDRWELPFHRLKQQVDHELDDLSRGEVLPGLLIILFVELADEFLKHVAHAEIGQAGKLASVQADGVMMGKIDVRGHEFLDDAVEGVRFRHFPDLVTKIELGDDLGDVGAESVEVMIEIGFELGGITEQAFQGEFRGVVKDLAGSFVQSIRVEDGHLRLGFLELHLGEHGVLGFLQQAIDPPENKHGQDDIPVFSTDKNIAQAVVRDGPDERNDFVVRGVIHEGKQKDSMQVTDSSSES